MLCIYHECICMPIGMSTCYVYTCICYAYRCISMFSVRWSGFQMEDWHYMCTRDKKNHFKLVVILGIKTVMPCYDRSTCLGTSSCKLITSICFSRKYILVYTSILGPVPRSTFSGLFLERPILIFVFGQRGSCGLKE